MSEPYQSCSPFTAGWALNAAVCKKYKKGLKCCRKGRVLLNFVQQWVSGDFTRENRGVVELLSVIHKSRNDDLVKLDLHWDCCGSRIRNGIWYEYSKKPLRSFFSYVFRVLSDEYYVFSGLYIERFVCEENWGSYVRCHSWAAWNVDSKTFESDVFVLLSVCSGGRYLLSRDLKV